MDKGKKILAGTRAYYPLPPLLTSTSYVTNNTITSQKKKLHASLSMTQLNKMCNFFLIVLICKIFLLFVEIWKKTFCILSKWHPAVGILKVSDLSDQVWFLDCPHHLMLYENRNCIRGSLWIMDSIHLGVLNLS